MYNMFIMTTNGEQLGQASIDAEAYIHEAGSLPEIDSASADLRKAIDQTRLEIDGADFAKRFPTEASDHFRTMLNLEGLAPAVLAAIEREGEAGHKRAHLLASLDRIDSGLNSLIRALVEIRADLVTSQDEL